MFAPGHMTYLAHFITRGCGAAALSPTQAKLPQIGLEP
jgi:hypothetical protein